MAVKNEEGEVFQEMRRAARTDSNQQEVIDRLREANFKVRYIKEPTDLIVAGINPRTGRRVNVLMEVKTDGGKLTKQQVEFIAEWPGPLHVVRDGNEAVEIMVEECKIGD